MNQNFLLDEESGDYILNLKDNEENDISIIYYSIEYIAIDSFEMFDKSVKLNKSGKSTYNEKINIDITQNENIKTEFIYNLLYLKELINIFSRIRNWDNVLDTLLFLISFSFVILYFKFYFIYLIPLPIIFLHIMKKSKINEIINNKNNETNKRKNELFFITLQEKYNDFIEGYEFLIQKVITGKNSIIIEIYKALIIVMISNIFLFHFNFFYLIKWRWIIVFYLWFYYLSKNSYYIKFYNIVTELFLPFSSQLNESLMYIQLKSLIKQIFTFFIPFYPLYKTLQENNSDIYISLVKSQGLKPTSSKNVLMASKAWKNNNQMSINNLIKFELYENERWWVIAGWTKNLIGSRPTWCRVDKPFEFCDKSNIFLPNDENNKYQWSADWKIEKNENTDSNGWEYADDFESDFGNNEKFKYVRRRKWVRYANKI